MIGVPNTDVGQLLKITIRQIYDGHEYIINSRVRYSAVNPTLNNTVKLMIRAIKRYLNN